MKPHIYGFSKFWIALISLLVAICFCQQTMAKKRRGGRSARMVIFPIRAPHLSPRQIEEQTQSLIEVSQHLNRFHGIPYHEVSRRLRQHRSLPKLLNRPTSALSEVRRICMGLRSVYALSIKMKLGTDRQPATLIGALFFCRDRNGRIERFELPFEGRLSRKVWTIFGELVEEEISRLPRQRVSQRRVAFPAPTPPRSPPVSQSFSPPVPPPRPTPIPMDMPSSPPKRESNPLTMSAPQPPTKMSAPENLMTESSRIEISGGARFLTKSFVYETKQNSRILQGGLSYDTQWLVGWGGKLQFRPFGGAAQALRGLSLFGSYERYTYESIRIYRSPISSSTKVNLPSDLNRWSGGFKYGYPLQTQQRTHQMGFSISYHGTLMNVAPNQEYLGLDTHLVDLGLFGEFVLSPSVFYLLLQSGFRPVASFGNRVTELGASAESYGASSGIGFRYRSAEGITLGLMIHLSFLFSEPVGEGRGGRIGESARDQTLSVDIDLGLSSNPTHQ